MLWPSRSIPSAILCMPKAAESLLHSYRSILTLIPKSGPDCLGLHKTLSLTALQNSFDANGPSSGFSDSR